MSVAWRHSSVQVRGRRRGTCPLPLLWTCRSNSSHCYIEASRHVTRRDTSHHNEMRLDCLGEAPVARELECLSMLADVGHAGLLAAVSWLSSLPGTVRPQYYTPPSASLALECVVVQPPAVMSLEPPGQAITLTVCGLMTPGLSLVVRLITDPPDLPAKSSWQPLADIWHWTTSRLPTSENVGCQIASPHCILLDFDGWKVRLADWFDVQYADLSSIMPFITIILVSRHHSSAVKG